MLLKDSVGGDLDMVCEILALEDLFTKNERDALQIGKRITHLIKKNLMNKNSHNTININMLNKSISNLLLDKTLARELRKEGDATLNMSDNNDIASRNKKVFILILDRLAKCYKARSKREEIRSAVLELGSDSRNDLATDAGWALIPMTTLEFRLLSNKNMLSIMTSLTFREPSYGECYWRIPSSLNAEDCLKRLNILRNSIDAIQGNGSICLHIKEYGNRVFIDIKDTGRGIQSTQLKAVFEPGYTTKKRGWGLGLSLVKRIIKDYHKGQVFVLQSELGKGTTFRISLLKS